MNELGPVGSLTASLAAAAVLAGLYLLAPRIRKLPWIPEAATGSFAGGLAVAYVFVHLLPDLSEGNQAVGAALDKVVEVTPLLDLTVFVVALAGFLLFYGLERLADRQGAVAPAASTTGGPGQPHGSPLAFRLHLASFFVYNAVITYTMPLRFRTGVVFAVLFTFAMGLHFVLTDRGLEEHYAARFRTRARLLLAAALLAGWAIAAFLAPTSVLVVSLLTAFLGGSILLNVFKEELPSNRQSSFSWFTVGLVGYATLLALTTYLSQ